MVRVLVSLGLCAFIAFFSWIFGSLYPAPSSLLAALHAQGVADRLHNDLATVDFAAMRRSVGDARFSDIAGHAAKLAASAGQAITVEHQATVDTSEAAAQPGAPLVMTAHLEPSSKGAGTPTPAANVSAGVFEPSLSLCPGMAITNAPAAAGDHHILRYVQRVNVQGVKLALDPTHGTCLSSGYGYRGATLHKGIDFYDRNGGPIMAGADGTVVEMKYRDDYGNMVLLDHGHGVYTRYAHMSAFAKGLAVGAHVHAGDPLGLMGNTAAYPIPIHLHYELLLGDYDNPKQSFGLTPHNPFEYAGG